MKSLIALTLLFTAACATQPSTGRKVASKNDCPLDITSDEDKAIDKAMIEEFKVSRNPRVEISEHGWQCFHAQGGYRASTPQFRKTAQGLFEEHTKGTYSPTVTGMVGSYTDMPETRNEIRMNRKGNLVIEFAFKRKKDGCPEEPLSSSDPENYRVQHMEICVPQRTFDKMLYTNP